MNTTKLKPRVLPLALMFAMLPNAKVWGQQTAPTLTASVLAQTAQMRDIHKKRRKIQELFVAAEAAVTQALEHVHRVEERMLDYLANAQGGRAEPLPDQAGRGTRRKGDIVDCHFIYDSTGSKQATKKKRLNV